MVTANKAGFGFVKVLGMDASVFLPPREMSKLMHGDRVRVLAEQGSDQRWSGRVDKVLERGIEAFLGTVEIHGRNASVRSADRRLSLFCHLSPDQLAGARHGDWVIARILKYPEDGSAGSARVVKLLDPEKPVTLATEAAIAKYDLPTEFTPAAQREAESHGREVDAAESARRTDIRGLPLVTIDGEDAKDFDDAVYAEVVDGGWRLIVAIADVSYYVREGGELDAEARARGTSVYFPTRVVPMLPHVLSDKLCSLEPHVDRLCLVADMQISRRGELKSSTFYPAVMRSAFRLTYNLAHAALFEGRPEARRRLGPLVEKLLPLVDVYHALLQARQKRGALDFDAPEARFTVDEAEHLREIRLDPRNDAHKLIEECMVLANVATAKELGRRGAPTLYRVHGEPDEKKIDNLITTLRAIGVQAEMPEEITPRDLQKIAPRVKDPAARPFVEQLVIRSMMQAIYQAGEHRSLRAGADALRALHLADPALSGSDRASHDQGDVDEQGRERPRVLAGRTGRAGRAAFRAREACRRIRPLRRQLPEMRLPAGSHRPDLRRPDHGSGGFRLLRADRRGVDRRAAARGQPAR